MLFEPVMDDSNDPDFTVGLNKLGIPENRGHNLFFVTFEESLEFATELELSSFIERFNHVCILPMII